MGRKRSERWGRNKRAFDEIIGDPYAKPEPIQGQYAALKSRSSVPIANIKGSLAESKNSARPSPVDFFCDVEAAIKDGLETYYNGPGYGDGYKDTFEDTFINTYIAEDENKSMFGQQIRSKLEQIIGRILIERGISPASKYFIAIRKKA